MNEYRIKAYAKINLGLDVVRRLENGYHEVKMVMQTVGIYDVLDFERPDGGIVIPTASGELPTDESNLICVMGGTALAEGIGEKLTPLAPAPDCYVLVAKPDINVSTKYVYEHLDAQEIVKHPDIDGMVEAIAEESLQGILDRMENVLETVTVSAYPIIQTIKDRMKELGAINSLMSGSGPTVFGIFVEKDMARRAYDKLEEEQLAKQIFLTEFCE